ncbi:hypothetical protein RB598_009872 [Gaeumannomyces tritici]
MSGKKRSRDGAEEEEPNAKDHMACDQCRIKKIRCGKERPQCSNCSRLAMYCEWSGYGKKPNQTVLLHQSIATIDSRLERIEGRVTSVYQMLQNMSSDCVAAVKPYSGGGGGGGGGGSIPETDSGYGYVPSMTSSNLLSGSPAGVPPPPTVQHIVHGPRGYERYFGPTSLTSLLHNFDDLPMPRPSGSGSGGSQAKPSMVLATAAAPPDRAPAAAAAAAGGAHGSLADAAERVRRLASVHRERQGARDATAGGADGRAMVKEPSMLILVALIDPYFELCNPHLPIWTRAGFRRLLDAAQESGGGAAPSTSLTFAMCANNLVLLTLIDRALRVQATSGGSMRCNGTIDVEVIQSHVENASRAVLHVGKLLEPRLVNVQALLSLCAVAQVCLSEEVFSLVLTLANQVAKSMGLHQPQGWSSSMSPEESEERRNVLYCLYCLDKTVSWNHGCAPSVGSTAGLLAGLTVSRPGPRLGPPEQPGGDGDGSGGGSGALYMSARFALAQIDDNLYASLYGPEAAAAPQGFEGQFRKISLEGFEARLGHWRKVYELENVDGGGGGQTDEEDGGGGGGRLSYASRLELKAACRFTRMQLLSRFVDDPGVCSALLEDARGCLVSLQQLWAATSDPGHCSRFARLVSSFPPMVVCRLAFQAATSEGPASGRDTELLGFLARSLQTMASMFAVADSYTSKLSAFVDIMLRFVHDSHQQEREEQHQRQNSVSSRHQQYSPASSQQQEQKVKTAHQTNTPAHSFRMTYDSSSSSSTKQSSEACEPLQARGGDAIAAASPGPVLEHVTNANCMNIEIDKGLATGLAGLFAGGRYDEAQERYVNGGDLEPLMDFWSHQQKFSDSMVFGELDSSEMQAEHNTWQ